MPKGRMYTRTSNYIGKINITDNNKKRRKIVFKKRKKCWLKTFSANCYHLGLNTKTHFCKGRSRIEIGVDHFFFHHATNVLMF